MTQQLLAWEGDFGVAYTERNLVDWQVRLPAFQQMLDGLDLQRVLEVGCNRGHNLKVLVELLGQGCDVVGVEPNRYALELARQATAKAGVLHGNIFDLPFKDSYFDMVLTAGVLIHVAPADLPAALAELHRVSRRYLLLIEYFAHQEEAIRYRDQDGLLWKRDFLRAFLDQFPHLSLVQQGYWGVDSGFDRTHWWLLEKPL
jgi:pseudaminic acid biosynthesis-associated methylase